MALQPPLRPLLIVGPYSAPHTLDIFLDYVCPFSAKLAGTIENVLKPLLSQKYDGKVKVIIRPQVQPWHASSTYTHEAAFAVARVSPENFWPFSLRLFQKQDDFFDIPVSTLTPLQIRDKLATIASEVIPPQKVDDFKELLKLKSSPNGGVAVTNDVKYAVKFSRQNGVHVSPSALWDGLIVNEVSSGWGEAEWSKFLAQNVLV